MCIGQAACSFRSRQFDFSKIIYKSSYFAEKLSTYVSTTNTSMAQSHQQYCEHEFKTILSASGSSSSRNTTWTSTTCNRCSRWERTCRPASRILGPCGVAPAWALYPCPQLQLKQTNVSYKDVWECWKWLVSQNVVVSTCFHGEYL